MTNLPTWASPPTSTPISTPTSELRGHQLRGLSQPVPPTEVSHSFYARSVSPHPRRGLMGCMKPQSRSVSQGVSISSSSTPPPVPARRALTPRGHGFERASSDGGSSTAWDISSRYMQTMRTGPTAWPAHIQAKHPDFAKSGPSPLMMYYFDESAPNDVLLANDVRGEHPLRLAKEQLTKLLTCQTAKQEEFPVNGDQYSIDAERQADVSTNASDSDSRSSSYQAALSTEDLKPPTSGCCGVGRQVSAPTGHSVHSSMHSSSHDVGAVTDRGHYSQPSQGHYTQPSQRHYTLPSQAASRHSDTGRQVTYVTQNTKSVVGRSKTGWCGAKPDVADIHSIRDSGTVTESSISASVSKYSKRPTASYTVSQAPQMRSSAACCMPQRTTTEVTELAYERNKLGAPMTTMPRNVSIAPSHVYPVSTNVSIYSGRMQSGMQSGVQSGMHSSVVAARMQTGQSHQLHVHQSQPMIHTVQNSLQVVQPINGMKSNIMKSNQSQHSALQVPHSNQQRNKRYVSSQKPRGSMKSYPSTRQQPYPTGKSCPHCKGTGLLSVSSKNQSKCFCCKVDDHSQGASIYSGQVGGRGTSVQPSTNQKYGSAAGGSTFGKPAGSVAVTGYSYGSSDASVAPKARGGCCAQVDDNMSVSSYSSSSCSCSECAAEDEQPLTSITHPTDMHQNGMHQNGMQHEDGDNVASYDNRQRSVLSSAILSSSPVHHYRPSQKTEKERDLGYFMRRHFFNVEKTPELDHQDYHLCPTYSVSYKNYPMICYDAISPSTYGDFFRVRSPPM